MPDTYGTLAGFKTWADDRAATYPVTSGADAQIEAALVKATEYLDGRYRGRWRGVKAEDDQALAWPRENVRDEDGILLDDDTVPTVVTHAAYRATATILDGTDLTPVLERGGRVKREAVSAGPVSSETEYASDAPARATITAIDDLLRGVLRTTGGWLERV